MNTSLQSVRTMNPTKPKALLNWSGGKDSSICLYKTLQSDDYDIRFLFTTLNARYNRVSQHGVRKVLLEKQAEHIGLPLKKLVLPETPTMDVYDRMMKKTLLKFQQEDIHISIFGDIFLEDLREYRENRLSEIGFKGVFPLWQLPTDQLAREFIETGFRAVVVCVDESRLEKRFTGRDFDESFLNDLPENVDPCGENGEFHTFVYDGPIFNTPVSFTKGKTVYRKYEPPEQEDKNNSSDYSCGPDQPDQPVTGFWYCDLIPV